MKNLRPLSQLLALVFCFAISAARGATFNFSYTFGDGNKASGSLTGTQSGIFVNSVSNVSLFFNGVAIPGIFSSKYDPATSSYLSGPVVSFDVLQNNFLFTNTDLVAGDFGFDSVFSLLNASVSGFGFATAIGVSLPTISSEDFPAVPSHWSLTAVTTGTVPDAGATLAMLGMTFAGMVWLRRKL